MKILITSGSTVVPIDKVRVMKMDISNIFKGKTGLSIANYFCASKENDVTLIASNVLNSIEIKNERPRLNIYEYKTYWNLYNLMESLIKENDYDVIIHSAAISDYEVKDVCVLNSENNLVSIDNTAKISSSHPELFLRMVQTPKIVDKIREWGFKGKLIKFKLQVDISDEQLIEIAEKSRIDSNADAIVANCLEWSNERAYIISGKNIYDTTREKLPQNIEKFIMTYL